ncbi:MAG: branched-chain amino acid aminotransferase [Vicingaceae bacterium]
MGVEQLAIKIDRIKESRLDQIDFNELKFGRDFSDHMLIADYENGSWGEARIMPFQSIPFSPAACVFHYGQAIFEGQKAHRAPNGDILLFRPEKNWERLNRSARRMCMAEVPREIFMEGIKALVDLDRNWIPEGDGKSLYIRPFLIADDGFLGVKPSEKYKFMVITSPTSNYYSGAVNVRIETQYSRACEGGIGAAKAAANYAASLLPAQEAKKAGYDQLIWTDAKEHKYIEESGTMNLMLRIGDTLVTPSLESNTILPGITRDSILFLAKEWGYKLEERKVEVAEVIDALKSGNLTEAFGMGTAATIAPIAKIGYEGKDYELSDFQNWEFASRLKAYLEGIKRGTVEDVHGWTVKL